MDRKEIAAVLQSAGLRPRHEFGQNFMVDQTVLRAIVAAGAVRVGDVVLEVGPGVGNLTRLLAQAVGGDGAVLAVDIDRTLLPAAQGHHAALANVAWLLADVLAGKHRVEPRVVEALRELRGKHAAGALKLVSNLPYNAASPLVAELLVEMWRDLRKTKDERRKTKDEIQFSRMAFTVQWEVALRMAAKPDTRDFGPLGVLIQAMADVEIVRKIPPGAFWPPPKVHSALVVVTPVVERIAAIADAPALQALLAGIFSHRRQTLGNALKHFLGDAWRPEFKRAYAAEGFDLLKRPETFAVADLLRLQRVTAALNPPPPRGGDVVPAPAQQITEL